MTWMTTMESGDGTDQLLYHMKSLFLDASRELADAETLCVALGVTSDKHGNFLESAARYVAKSPMFDRFDIVWELVGSKYLPILRCLGVTRR